ncbi:MAG: dephospho-CoA kinase [Gemmatimonadales bacterium]
MLNVALTGNIAAGKSAVADFFRRWGATVIDADQLVREAQRPGSPVLQAIARRFGADLIDPDGALNRSKLRAIVLGDATARQALNAIVHPEVQRRRDALLAAARVRGDRIVVSDIPLLFEVLDPAGFDVVVLVEAPEEVRLRRLMTGRGLDRTEAEQMIRAQLPTETKRDRSHHGIDNDGDLAALERRAREVWEQLGLRAKD